jgi:hypothetical protein
MSTGNFANWDGTIQDLGPLYPFVGSEVVMVIILIVLWVAWHVAQMKGENAELEHRVQRFRRAGELQKALDSERTIERM